MNAVSEDIKDIILEDSSLGLDFGTNLVIGREPASPGNCVTIFDIPGYSPQLLLDGEMGFRTESFQIRIRNTNYTTGYALANTIMVLLHGLEHVTYNSTLYMVIYCTSGPAMLGWDDNNRVIFITNFNVLRR
jgi:hypothetical protein